MSHPNKLSEIRTILNRHADRTTEFLTSVADDVAKELSEALSECMSNDDLARLELMLRAQVGEVRADFYGKLRELESAAVSKIADGESGSEQEE